MKLFYQILGFAMSSVMSTAIGNFLRTFVPAFANPILNRLLKITISITAYLGGAALAKPLMRQAHHEVQDLKNMLNKNT